MKGPQDEDRGLSPQDTGSGPEREIQFPDYYRDTYLGLYSWLSRFYDTFVGIFLFLVNGGPGGERRWREHVIDRLDPRPGDRIIDLCSGTGRLTIMIGKRLAGSGEVIGIEMSPAQFEMAGRKRKPDVVSFVNGDARRTGYSDGYFDKAVISGALHELPKAIRAEVLSEAFRITHPGGSLVVTEHNRPAAEWKARLFDFLERFNPEHPTYRDLLDSGLEREIGQAGFSIVETDTTAWDFFQTVVAERPAKCDTH
jgi:ubiquinone/menaquinone biosynthesis C-methylase UbiE